MRRWAHKRTCSVQAAAARAAAKASFAAKAAKLQQAAEAALGKASNGADGGSRCARTALCRSASCKTPAVCQHRRSAEHAACFDIGIGLAHEHRLSAHRKIALEDIEKQLEEGQAPMDLDPKVVEQVMSQGLDAAATNGIGANGLPSSDEADDYASDPLQVFPSDALWQVEPG